MAEQYQPAGSTAAEISASIESGVRTGQLAPGAALPAVRALATELGISPATVAKAYQELRQRGVIVTAGRNGTRIRPRPPVALPSGGRRLPPAPGLLDLASGHPTAALLPPLGPHLARLAERIGPQTGYARAPVLPELGELARARFTADGVPADALTVTAGALDSIERLFGAHLRPGDAIAVEDPGWANVLDLAAALGLRPIGVPVDDDGPTPAGVRAALAAGARALVVTCRAQNPTGAAVGAVRAAELRTVLADHPDVLLIEDDHAAELTDVPLHPLSGATRSWAFVRSVSKPYGPDLRLAVLSGDDVTVARVQGRARVGAGWVSTVLQHLVVALWQDPEVAALVARAREHYRHRRDLLRDSLAAHGIASTGRTGVNVWVPVADETHVVASLRDAGYAVAPGSLYRIAGPPGIRITIGDLTEEAVAPLAEAVAHAIHPAPSSGFTR